ncbi:MAG: hypothetical protein MUD06_05965 [Rhodospirillales bacterium]|jgi:hypothetical protein|nr:hypothetical protein [Rhodospirillales bacterium]
MAATIVQMHKDISDGTTEAKSFVAADLAGAACLGTHILSADAVVTMPLIQLTGEIE